MNLLDLYAILAPREGSKKRRVLNHLLDGEWHTGEAICEAYRRNLSGFRDSGWEWQGCISQLRKALRRRGGDIVHRSVEGRIDGEYRLVLPQEPDHRETLRPHIARTSAVVATRRELVGNMERRVPVGAQGGLFDG